MKETRTKIQPLAELVTYQIRAGIISNEGGDKIWRMALQNPGKCDAMMGILDMELDEADTIRRIERLV